MKSKYITANHNDDADIIHLANVINYLLMYMLGMSVGNAATSKAKPLPLRGLQTGQHTQYTCDQTDKIVLESTDKVP